ncbi:MAG TPA: serine hydrolase [Vicinamibacterales bacterium]|nr:serine hydrolase [Vicinamibacterales bacterium]
MRSALLCVGLVLSVTLFAAAPDADPIETIVRTAMDAQRIPGVAVAVVQRGEVLKAQGYGLADVEHEVPVSDETIFQSGSLGKQFTAAAVMLLVEDGAVSLSDPLTQFFPDAPAAWKDVTVRHLLTHTSGIPEYTDGKIDYRRDYSEGDLVRFAYDLPLEFTPGAQWSYSNTGYVLLGAIVRKASGEFYGDLLRDRVFRPAGMNTARVISEADIVPHRAAGYRRAGESLQNQDWVSPSLNTTADGALYLSLRDWIAWDRALRARAILKPESWDAIYGMVRLNSGRRHPYGFGWVVDRVAGQEVRRHGGAWQGFTAHIARYLGDDVTVIVLANLAGARTDRIVNEIAAHYVPKLREPATWTIVGAQLADGTGAPLRRADVRIVGDAIKEVGAVTPHPDDRVIDGTGLVLAPGFIDAHNHSTEGLESEPDALSQISQGVTTVVVGQDGSSPFPVREYLARRRANPPAPNVAVLVGHATMRRQVMGEDFRRTATPAEIRRMEALVDQEMRDGAIGLSSGLEYEVGSYASTDEVIALARVAGRHGGFYISHIRDEADRTLEAVREAIAIGERARLPVQITHIKLGTVGVWGRAPEVARMIENARRRGLDVTADAYPYLAWSSNLKVLVPNKQWTDPASVEEALRDVGGGRNVQITRLPKFPQYVGRRLDEIARAEGISEADLYIRIVQDEDAGVIGHTMTEDDLRTFYRQPWVMIASDGGINFSHPRGAGTFPRVLGRYVRESQVLSLPEAIRKMTSLPASRLRLADRGVVRAGMKADLVLFDPDAVVDLATFEHPRRQSRGIHTVFVNGVPIRAAHPLPYPGMTDRLHSGRPGRVIAREKADGRNR